MMCMTIGSHDVPFASTRLGKSGSEPWCFPCFHRVESLRLQKYCLTYLSLCGITGRRGVENWTQARNSLGSDSCSSESIMFFSISVYKMSEHLPTWKTNQQCQAVIHSARSILCRPLKEHKPDRRIPMAILTGSENRQQAFEIRPGMQIHLQTTQFDWADFVSSRTCLNTHPSSFWRRRLPGFISDSALSNAYVSSISQPANRASTTNMAVHPG